MDTGCEESIVTVAITTLCVSSVFWALASYLMRWRLVNDLERTCRLMRHEAGRVATVLQICTSFTATVNNDDGYTVSQKPAAFVDYFGDVTEIASICTEEDVPHLKRFLQDIFSSGQYRKIVIAGNGIRGASSQTTAKLEVFGIPEGDIISK